MHGNSSSHQSFLNQFNSPLLQDFELFTLDLAGHGQSGKLGSYSIKGMVEFLVSAAKEFDLEDAIFVGHSLGGHLLVEALPHLPKARGLVIFGTPPLENPPRLERMFLPHPAGQCLFKGNLEPADLEAWFASCFSAQIDSEAKDRFIQTIRMTDPLSRIGLGSSLVAGEYSDEAKILAETEVPVCVIHGEQDQLINGAAFEGLNIPTLWMNRVHRIDAGHYPHIEKADEFNRILQRFVLSNSQ